MAEKEAKEVTLEFKLSNALRYKHEFEDLDKGQNKINEFALGELNLADNKVTQYLDFDCRTGSLCTVFV